MLVPHDPRTDRGYIELLPFFFGKLNAYEPLTLSLAATSRFIFGSWYRKSQALETAETQAAYGKALSATSEALQHPTKRLTDEILMAVLLLGLYEVCGNT